MNETAFTGERFLPTCAGEIAYEHWHRYAFARSLAVGKRVLDVACGEGYGAAFLSDVASSVWGVDIDATAIRDASVKYADYRGLQFIQGSCTDLPFPDQSFGLIVSFETIEHIDADAQLRTIEELARLLEPGGLLVISSPNKALYSDARQYRNEHHVRELYRDEFAMLLSRRFRATQWFHQRLQFWSGIWSADDSAARLEAWSTEGATVTPYTLPDAMYYVVLAALSPEAIPRVLPRTSLLTDRGDSVLERFEAETKQLIRQYEVVDELAAAADRQTLHIRHLEQLILERDQLTDQQASHIRHLEQLIAARDETMVRSSPKLDALTQQVLQLKNKAIENDSTIMALRHEVMQLSKRLHELNKWRSWVRFPFRRFRNRLTKKAC